MSLLDERLTQLRGQGRMAQARGPGLGKIAFAATQEAPDKVVVHQGGHSLTRARMLELALRLGGGLAARGVEPGAVIAMQLPNWWEACVINLAASLFGYRLVPLLMMYRQAELAIMLPASGATVLFLPARFKGKDFAQTVQSLADPPQHIFALRGGESSFEHLVAHEARSPRLPADDDAKVILFTSGSTGRPKGVVHTHGSISAVVANTADYWGIGADDHLYVPSPIGHIGGSIYAFELPWMLRCTATLAESWDPDQAVRDIDSQGMTFMAGATPFLEGLISASQASGSRLPSLRRFICGGAAVPADLIHRALDRFPNATVSRAYGSSEVPLVCPGVRDRKDARQFAHTDGEITCDLRLTGADGGEVSPGEVGEIAVRSPHRCAGYLDAGDEAGVFLDDGFFAMGDLGRQMGGTFLEITGRTKDIIIRKGENISPLEIEAALATHADVQLAAVIGRADPERGEMVVAIVTVKDQAQFSMTEMTRHLDALGLARQKFPEALHVAAELPTTSVGKIDKPRLRAMFG